jgi:broad specificity phosphatase PhoE
MMASGPLTVFIVRHGATKMNNQTDLSEDRIRAWTDVPLVEEGREEARRAGLKLKGKNIKAIISSDLVRAKETAEIIGKIIGVPPEFSPKLRPWKLGTFTGASTKEALPKIAEYVRNKPDEPVPQGESFNQFKDRAFEGFAQALAAHPDGLVIVSHHRNERLIAGWERAGQPPDHSIDLEEFLQKGDPPGGVIIVKTTEAALIGKGGGNGPSTKLSHGDAHYRAASGKDKCSTCRAYNGPNDCDKVESPIYPGGWCAVGKSKLDGHRFDPKGAKIEKEYGMAGKLPSINAGMNELRGQMARGAQGPSSANIGGRMGAASPAMGGATAGLGANPSRMGNPPVSAGNYQQIAGSPGPSAPPTSQSVRTHSLALGGMKHLVAAGHLQPAHAKAMEAKSRAHIAAYKGAKGQMRPAASQPRRFGSLGGMGGGGPAGIAPGQAGDAIPGASPTKMDW